ncbi:uncharacterized protein [Muntiacus reevesi]|uniref:uncharacterized protein n=1 Tax=Muntiacus reevesi TaxID=9886 RepID=UPI0033074473
MWRDAVRETPLSWKPQRRYLLASLAERAPASLFGACCGSPRSRELSAAPSAGLEAPGLALRRRGSAGDLCDRRLCQEPRRPRRPARVSCVVLVVRVCLVSQSLDARLLARDSQALQLKRSCLWFSGCVSGTRLSLKPLIYHPENNQICPRGPQLPPPQPSAAAFSSPPLCRPPFSPAFPYPHNMVLKLPLELEAAVGLLERRPRLKLRLLSPSLPIVIGGSRSAGACR